MKKRLISLMMALPLAAVSYADNTVTASISDATGGIATYLPFVRSLCYVIAAIIAIVGATSVYLSMQTNPQQTRKRIMVSVGSCMTFVFMATALPQFFGLDGSMVSGESGSNNGRTPFGGLTAGGTGGFLVSDMGGISQSGINTSIPPLSDGNWIHFPSGTSQGNANLLLDLWESSGNGSEGSYGRTLSSIQNLYNTHQIDFATYQDLISIAGSLPHS